MAAIASLTAQNTRGVRGVFSPPAAFLARSSTRSATTSPSTRSRSACSARRQHRRGRPLAVDAPATVRRARPGDGGHQRRPAARRRTPSRRFARCCRWPTCSPRTSPNWRSWSATSPPLTWTARSPRASRWPSATGARVLVKGGHLGAGDPAAQRPATDALVAPDGVRALLPGPWVETKQHPRHRLLAVLGAGGAAPAAGQLGRRGGGRQGVADRRAGRPPTRSVSGHGRGPVDHLHAAVPGRRFLTQVWSRIAPIRAAIETMPFITRAGRRVAAVAELPLLPGPGRLLPAGIRALPGPGRRAGARSRTRRSSSRTPRPGPWRRRWRCIGSLLSTARRVPGWRRRLPRDGGLPRPSAPLLRDRRRMPRRSSLGAALLLAVPAHRRAAGGATDGRRTPVRRVDRDLRRPRLRRPHRRRRSGSRIAPSGPGPPPSGHAMDAAFERSSRYEWMFFAQGTKLPAWPV